LHWTSILKIDKTSSKLDTLLGKVEKARKTSTQLLT